MNGSFDLTKLKDALDHSAIVAITDSTGKIIEVNDKFCQISKYSRTELLGQNHRIVNSGHHPREFFAQMWQTISSGKRWEGEIKNRAKDGTHYWVNTTITPFLDPDGKPEMFVAIRYEVTRRKLAEQRLNETIQRLEESNVEIQQREENFRNLLNSTFEGVVVFRKDGTILDANAAACEIFGIPFEKLLGTNIKSYFTEQSRVDVIMETIHPVQRNAVGERPDGTRRHLELLVKTYEMKGESVLLAATRDVTDRKLLEAKIIVQDRLASIGLLASSLAHEIGTPLGVIRGRAEYVVSSHKGDPMILSNMSIIITQIDRVSKLIHSLLNLARGEVSTSASEILLGQITQDVVDLLGHELEKNDIELINEVNALAAIKIFGKPESLHQVLLNLIVNSIHAIQSAKKAGRTDQHSIRLSTHVRGEWTELSVTDTGCGISKQNMGELFKPFYTTKDIGSGTGLGLATCYRIVETWNGSIQVESEEGVGTTFKVLLPLVRQE